MQPGASQSAPTEAEWSIAPNHFPSICFVSLNMSEIPIRRKSHFGKNLACDLTPGIKAGRNTVEMSVHLSAEEKSRIFVVAVEQIETFDQLQCTQQLMLIEQPVSLAAIVASLTSANDDDEIAIVDPHISIDLIDPFTAQICRIPVRGKSCTHRECFDLQAFLESRPSKVKGVPLTSADEWKCPICNKDARPQCLLLDGLLLNVCTQARGEETEEVKAIMVSADGGWKWKVENRRQAEREGSDGPGLAVWRDRNMNRESSRSTPSKDTIIKDAGMGRLEVIELDDD
jgi:zinc finger MIZ domain-containing protein